MPDAKIIDAFGGTTKLATLLRLDPRVVWNWRTRGIPKPWRYVILDRAETVGVSLPKNFLPKKGTRNGR